MAILTNRKEFKTGDEITAETVNDIIDTAVAAQAKAAEIETKAGNGDFDGEAGNNGAVFEFPGGCTEYTLFIEDGFLKIRY